LGNVSSAGLLHYRTETDFFFLVDSSTTFSKGERSRRADHYWLGWWVWACSECSYTRGNNWSRW